jgi:very-short-patch-repair endonuclease
MKRVSRRRSGAPGGRIGGLWRLMVVVRPQIATVERKIAQLANRSHGVVSREDLIRIGMTKAQIRSRLARGDLIPIHRGVFRVGHAAPSLEARYFAAVKAAGQGALLCGRAAAHLLGLLRRPPPQPEVLTTRRRQPSGVKISRCRAIDRRDRTSWRGVPVTTVPRTIIDLAAVLDPPDLAQAFHEAAVRHRVKPESVETILARRHNWPGARELQRVIRGDEPVSLSKLESSFIAAVRRARLPLPETNVPAGTRRVDCRWPDHRLTVELDSYRYHNTRHAFEHDRQREREARARGDEFRRYTWADVSEAPGPMLADLRALLERQLLLRSERSLATRPRGASEPPRGTAASSATGSRSAGSALG